MPEQLHLNGVAGDADFAAGWQWGWRAVVVFAKEQFRRPAAHVLEEVDTV
jgi:hypothetical protein